METKQIGIFGKRNMGKSSLINLLLGQDVALVSPIAGTTADPVRKRMEIPGVGPVRLMDTAGIDDGGEEGAARVAKSLEVLSQTDFAMLVFTANVFGKEERDLVRRFNEHGIPYLLVHNQSDIVPLDPGVADDLHRMYGADVVEFSCALLEEAEIREEVSLLVSFIVKGLSTLPPERTILQGLVGEGDRIVLVCPIDDEAPEGRLILPQAMAVRDVLDHRGIATVLQPSQLPAFLEHQHPHDIRLAVIDSQLFPQVQHLVPESVPLTSFSMLLARAKGPFEDYVRGCRRISGLRAGDKVLILESCTHHASCDDIGRVKLPAMLEKSAGARLEFTFVSGTSALPRLDGFALAVQCGGCMATRRELHSRIAAVLAAGIPVTNYGMAMAFFCGTFERALAPLTAAGR